MKLKKIASLALAGLMAVSMLAGCGDNSSSNGNGTDVTPSTSSVVNVFNDEQDEDADVKVVFSASSTLESDLSQALRILGQDATATEVDTQLRKLNGIIDDNWYDENTANADVKAGSTATKLVVKEYASSNYWNENAALKAAVKEFESELIESDELVENNWKQAANDGKDKYLVYDYTGNVVMVSVEKVDGQITYYVAYTVTQTVSEKDF